MKIPTPRKLKSGTWFIQLRLGGESISVTAATEKECRRQAALLKAEHLNGKRVQASDITLWDAIDQYIAARQHSISPSTVAGYRAIQRLYFQDVSRRPLSSVENWQAQIDRLAATHSGKTVKNAWGFISSVLRSQKVEPPDVTLPQVIDHDAVWLDPDQIRVFVSAVKNTPACTPALLALHSLRRSEIMALKWDHVDLKKRTFQVVGAAVYDENHKLVQKPENKNRSSRRTLPIMIPELFDSLNAVEDKNGYVVTCCPNTLWKQFNRICEKSGLPLVGVHGLRHSFASLAYHLRFSELDTMHMGGWHDAATMRKIYTHLAEKDALKAQNKMHDFYNTSA